MMSAEDYIFEDPWESYDRCIDDGWEPWKGVSWSRKKEKDRKCTVCGQEFKSRYPSACPECGGWTDEQ